MLLKKIFFSLAYLLAFIYLSIMTHLPSIITDLAFLLIVAGIVTIIFKWLKQPVVLGYIVAGFLTGTHSSFFPSVVDGSNISVWGEIGVIFLLFALGLEFSFKKLLNNGKTGFITLVVIVCGLGGSGYLLGLWMGWGLWNSVFLGCMLCLSSTTIIVKAFEDPRYKGKRFTEVVFGILIFDDLFAILLMVFMGTLAVSRNFEGTEIMFSLGKMFFFMIVWVVCGIFLIPTLLKKLKNMLNDETLLILSLGMCLGMVVFATYVGLSAELGAFIMGSILAETVSLENIERVTKPIKDFFGTIFFVSVGMLLEPQVIIDNYLSIILITLLVLFGKVIFTAIGARLSGEPMKIAVQSGFSMAQVGEFSFIVAGTAITYELADNFIYPIIIAVSILTTFTTPYLMAGSDGAYDLMMRKIPHSWSQKILETDNKLALPVSPTAWAAFMKNYIFNIIVFGVLCIAVIILSVNTIYPFTQKYVDNTWTDTVYLLLTLLIMAPLLKGLVYRGGEQPYLILKLWQQSVGNRLVLSALIVIRYVIAFGLVYFVFWRLLDIPLWISAIVAISLLLLIFRSKYLLNIYWNMEYRFVLNFNQRMIHEKRMSSKEKGATTTYDLDNESWIERNLYIGKFKLNPGAEYENMSLLEADFRDKYDLIIVAVYRNNKELFFPNGDFILLAEDILTVAGNIIQIDLLAKDKNKIERYSLKTIHEYAKQHDEDLSSKIKCISLVVDQSSGLCGKSLLQLEIGKRGSCFIVGIERNRGYQINPPASEVFHGGDIIWLVGNKDSIHKLVNENFSFDLKM